MNGQALWRVSDRIYKRTLTRSEWYAFDHWRRCRRRATDARRDLAFAELHLGATLRVARDLEAFRAALKPLTEWAKDMRKAMAGIAKSPAMAELRKLQARERPE